MGAAAFFMKGKKMVEVTLPYEFVGGSKAIANQVNANFEAISRGFTGVNVALEELKAEVEKFNNKPLRDSFDIIVSLIGTAPVGAYPLWTGEWIYNARSIYKDFYLCILLIAIKCVKKYTKIINILFIGGD